MDLLRILVYLFLRCISVFPRLDTRMTDRSDPTSAEEVASSFHISERAGHNYVHMRQWEFFEKSLANPWTSECPEGV